MRNNPNIQLRKRIICAHHRTHNQKGCHTKEVGLEDSGDPLGAMLGNAVPGTDHDQRTVPCTAGPAIQQAALLGLSGLVAEQRGRERMRGLLGNVRVEVSGRVGIPVSKMRCFHVQNRQKINKGYYFIFKNGCHRAQNNMKRDP